MTSILLGPLVGGLTHKRAHIWARADGPGVLHAWLGHSPDLADARLAGISLMLSSENGFAGVAPVSGLSPDTQYHYTITLNDTPPDRVLGPYPSFTTFPLPGQPRSFTFTFGSCFRPEEPHSGQIFERLEEHRQQENLRFGLMLGDQIYADAYAHNGLGKIACSLEDYRAVYAYTWSRPALHRLFPNLPVFMTLDDHEVDDDWTWTDANRTHAQIPIWDKVERILRRRSRSEWRIPRQRVQDALKAYWEHQGMHAPHYEQPPDLTPQGKYALNAQDRGSLAYAFNFGAAAFFVLDTRTMRICNRRERILLGEDQWRTLEDWLERTATSFPIKFIVTSCSLLYHMVLDFPRDRWSGFPAERARLINFLAARGIEGVYLLTGDLHSSHAVSADLYGPGGRAVPLWEFCSSPFEQKPNWFSRFSYRPLTGLPLKNQKVHFTIGQVNYGLVRVDFDEIERPHVHFEVYGKNGERLASVP